MSMWPKELPYGSPMPASRNKPLILALDMGTSSSRAALFDVRGERVAGTLVQRAYPLKSDASGAAELDPAVLLRAVTACLKAALSKGGGQVRALGVSCFWHSLIGTDAAGEPLTPVYTWADSRCRADAARLRDELSEKSVHEETGCMLRSSFWPAKLRWLRRTQPAVFRQVRFWMSPAEWLQAKLTGLVSCALGMATGTGLFDPRTNGWSPRMLEMAGVKASQLNPLSDEPVPWQGMAWHPGIGDGAAHNLGCGATHAGLAAINFGTSAAIRVMAHGARPVAPSGLFCYRVDARRYLIGGAMSNAGNLHAWCLRELRLPNGAAALEKAMSTRLRPEHGLTVLPFWTAERAPTWNENALGSVRGMTQSTTALDLLQAITEASYVRLARIAELLPLEAKARCVLSGGILHSPSSLKRLANVLGRPLYRNPEPEGSLRGAAVFVLEKLGFAPAPLKFGRPIPSDPKMHALYREQREKQGGLE